MCQGRQGSVVPGTSSTILGNGPVEIAILASEAPDQMASIPAPSPLAGRCSRPTATPRTAPSVLPAKTRSQSNRRES